MPRTGTQVSSSVWDHDAAKLRSAPTARPSYLSQGQKYPLSYWEATHLKSKRPHFQRQRPSNGKPSDNVKPPSESSCLRPPLEQVLPSTAHNQDHGLRNVHLHPGYPPLTKAGKRPNQQLQEISHDTARQAPFSCLLRATEDVITRQTSYHEAYIHVVSVKAFSQVPRRLCPQV